MKRSVVKKRKSKSNKQIRSIMCLYDNIGVGVDCVSVSGVVIHFSYPIVIVFLAFTTIVVSM